jgi:hypothetical protein
LPFQSNVRYSANKERIVKKKLTFVILAFISSLSMHHARAEVIYVASLYDPYPFAREINDLTEKPVDDICDLSMLSAAYVIVAGAIGTCACEGSPVVGGVFATVFALATIGILNFFREAVTYNNEETGVPRKIRGYVYSRPN